MAIDFIITTGDGERQMNRRVQIPHELLVYLRNVESAIEPNIQALTGLDEYGDIEFGPGQTRNLAESLVRVRTELLKGVQSGDLPSPPELVDLEADEREFGEAGLLDTLDELRALAVDAAASGGTLTALGD